MLDLETLRWNGKIRCTNCFSLNPVLLSQGDSKKWNVYRCRECSNEFTVLSGTKLSRTKLSPDQIRGLLSLKIENRLGEPPSTLCKLIGVHHWTMTKLINRIKDIPIYDLISRPGLTRMEEFFKELPIDEETLIPALVLVTYKYHTHHPKGLQAITGCTEDFAIKAVERIRKCWVVGKEFVEEEGNWFDPDGWKGAESVIRLTLHCMAIMGIINRDPATEMWSLPEGVK